MINYLNAIASDILEDGVLLASSATWPSSSHSASFSIGPLLSLSISVSPFSPSRGEREKASFAELLWWEGKDDDAEKSVRCS